MNILVTGGAGYIGSAVAAELLKHKHHIVVLDSLETGHRGALPKGVEFVDTNLSDKKALHKLFAAQKFEVVFHFAGLIEAGESMRDPGKYLQANTVNTLNLLEAMHAAGTNRIVFSSTAAVYQSSDDPLSEDSPLGPQNVYGETKLMVEQMLEWYRKVHGLRYAALRYFNASGALPDRGEGHQPESHLIPLTLQVALGQRESVAVFGSDYPTPDGTCIRDYIHIADLVAAHLLAFDALETRDQLVYNLGSGHGYSVLQVIEMARKISGHPIPAVETPRRPGDAARLVASPARIKSELGWETKHSGLEEIVSSAWAWHKTHPHGYKE
jgi:UDP-glucose 4-epimerase